MAVLRRPEPRRNGRRHGHNILRDFDRRQSTVRAVAAHARVQLAMHNLAIEENERLHRAAHFLADVAAGIPPRAEDRAAWVALDRADEFWDIYGLAHVSQANLPV